MHILRGRGLGKTATGEALEEPESAAWPCGLVRLGRGFSATFIAGWFFHPGEWVVPSTKGFEQLRLGGCNGWR